MSKKLFAGAAFALALFVAGTASAFTFDSKIDTLQEKKDVQTVLNMNGATLTVDGVLGAKSIAAVKAFQTLKGLVADGKIGPMTRAALTAASTTTGTTTGTTLPAGCVAGALFSSTTGAPCTGTTTPVTTVTGGAGSMNTSTVATDIENKVIEGGADTKNLGFKVEASDSDIKITNMKITMVKGGSATASSYLDRYVSDVSVWMNGSKVATVAASDFSKEVSGKYTKSVSLANAIVKEGSTNKATFYVTTTGVSNIDTADMDGTWTMTVDNIRFTDGTGAIMTYGTAIISQELDVTDITSGDVKMVISKGSATPLAGNVEVSTTGSTSDVLMLEVKAKNTGADMTFDAMTFNLTSDASISKVLGELILKEGSTELASLSTFATNATSDTVTFNLDDTYTVKAGETKYFRVYATINDADNFTGGNYLKVAYNKADTKFEVASTRTVFTETGDAVGENQSFYSKGAVVKFVSDSYTAPDKNASTEGTIALTFTVTAFGDEDIIINKDATSTSINGGVAVVAEVTGGTPSGSVVTASGMTADGQGNFTVSAGDTKTFTISKKLPAVSGFVSMKITDVGVNTVSNVETRAF